MTGRTGSSISFWSVKVLEQIGRPFFHLFLRLIEFFFPSKKKFLSVVSLVAIASLLWVFYISIIKDLPQPDKLITRDQSVTTKIYDRKYRLLYKIYRRQNRTLVKLEEIPLALRQATIAIEDSDFYRHSGFTFKGIVRATLNNLFHDTLQGGSTITQQLVKTALLSSEKTLTRKIRELILAIQVEARFSKDEILQMYLNEVGYGGATYGAEEAAQLYFGKNVSQLDLTEAALLAGLPQSPTQYSPFGAHPELAKQRQIEVLRRMLEEGFITESRFRQAQNRKLSFIQPHSQIQAPHFVMYIKDRLVSEYGAKIVEEGGLEVITSLDLDIQKMAEAVVATNIEKLKSLNVSNGAVLITNPATGEILAMVGSKDYFNLEEDGNVNVTLRPRQPGSAIKVVNYAYALSHGYTPATILSDTPISFQVPGQPVYAPRNYDFRFHGQVPLRVALASSYNVPAVKVLASYGVDKMIDQGEKMGITTWPDRSRFGLSLTLGGGEVKMSDLAVVYATLANLGKRVDLKPILEVKNYQGEKFEIRDSGFEIANERVLAPGVAYMLTDILSDNRARMPTFGANSLLVIPGHTVAVKTGTTQNLRDNWTIGYTPSFLIAVWVGNNDNAPMHRVASGVTGATPIWHQIMKNLLVDQSDEAFPKPSDLIEVQICSLNSLLPCQGCPSKIEYFLPGTEPKTHCDPEKMKQPSPSPESQILEGLTTER